VTAIASRVIITLNEQVAWRDCASVAAQLTEVVPKGKDAPEAGVQVVVTGSAPPVTAGEL